MNALRPAAIGYTDGHERGLLMAKGKATTSKGGPKRGRPKAGAKTMKTLGYRVTPQYLEWLEKVANANGSTISRLIDEALRNYAPQKGVAEPAPKRTA
jgi:hypothetical protein